MSRVFSEAVNQPGDSNRRDQRGPRHSKEGGNNFDLRPGSAPDVEMRTRYPHTVVSGDPQPLKPGNYNTKIGGQVRKGHLIGSPIFTLTLEERATCPTSCLHWLDCFGNKMHMGKRQQAGPELEDMLECQLLALELMYPRGFLVRLHVLGDFYSPAYAELWGKWLKQFTALNVFGYTAWPKESLIGEPLYATMMDNHERFALRWSDRDWQRDNTVSLKSAADAPVGVIVCPAQTGQTECCATCSFCWESRQPVGFIEH